MTAPTPDEAISAGIRAAWDHIPADRAVTVRGIRAAVTAALTAAAPHIRTPLEAEVERLRGRANTIAILGREVIEHTKAHERMREQLADAEDAIADYAAAVADERARVLGEVQEALRPVVHANRRLRVGLIASADLLDVPFTNSPLSPWTRLIKPALVNLDEAIQRLADVLGGTRQEAPVEGPSAAVDARTGSGGPIGRQRVVGSAEGARPECAHVLADPPCVICGRGMEDESRGRTAAILAQAMTWYDPRGAR